MAVTTFAFLTLLSDSTLRRDFFEKLDKVIDSQDAVVAEQQSTTSEPAGSAQRPVGFFQQVEDPARTLGISEWPSLALFKAWRMLASGDVAIHDMATHIANDGKPTGIIVAEGSFLQPTTKTDGRIPLLKAQYMELSRWLVPPSKRAEFYSTFEALRRHRMSMDIHNVVFGSWSLDFPETAQESDLSEFIMAAGYDEPQPMNVKNVENASDISPPETLLREMAVSFDIKHYTKCA